MHGIRAMMTCELWAARERAFERQCYAVKAMIERELGRRGESEVRVSGSIATAASVVLEGAGVGA